MKRIILLYALMLIVCNSYGQTDDLLASNIGSTGSEDKAVASRNTESVTSEAWKHINFGMVFTKLSDTENAIREYNYAINLDNSIAEAFDYRAVCYIKLGKYRKALADLEDAIDINPAYSEAYNHLGIASYWLEDYESAINFYTRAVSLNPSYGTPYFNRAIVYLVLDEYQLALKDLNKAKELNMEGVDAILNEYFADKK
jgi:tetratricopeptide (TPR) repeat protein